MEIKINLLPDYRKDEIAKANRFKMVIRLGVVMLSIFALFYSFLFILLVTLDMDMKSVRLSQETLGNHEQLEKIRKFDAQFEGINSSVKQSLALERDQLYWTSLFSKLEQNMSDGITITDLATKDYSILLAGKATDRDMLMQYKDKLSQEKCFTDINLPLSNLVSKDNISFQMDLKISRDCLKLNAQ